jgi:hypothetical protein
MTFTYERVLRWALAAALGASLAHLLLAQLGAPPFTADSWTYRELARTLSGDFYALTTWRAYHSTLPYSTAFPPLWPALLALADPAGGLGIYSGYILNFLLFGAFAVLLEHTARRLGMAGLGLAGALVLLAYPPFADEIVAARSMPLAMLLLAGLLHLLALRRDAAWMPLAFGALAGAAVMTRFDLMLPMAAVWALAFLPRLELRRALVAGAALGAACAPWIGYSLAVHGRLFATDNSRVALSLDPRAFVTDYPLRPEATLFDAPAAWSAKLAGRLGPLADALWQALVLTPALWLAALLALLALALRGRERAAGELLIPEPGRRLLGACALLGGGLAAGWVALLATGYLDLRYFSPVLWLVALVALVPAYALARREDRLGARGSLLPAIAAAAALVLANVEFARGGWQAPPRFHPALFGSAYFEPLLRCLSRAGAAPTDGVLFVRNDDLAAWFGAASGQRTAMIPWNLARLDAARFADFLRDFDVRYVFVTEPQYARLLAGKAQLGTIAGCEARLYDLRPLEGM